MTWKQGTVVVDTLNDKIGVFMDKRGSRAYLRPVGGGREWPVGAGYVREATPEECASAQAAMLARPAPIRRP